MIQASRMQSSGEMPCTCSKGASRPVLLPWLLLPSRHRGSLHLQDGDSSQWTFAHQRRSVHALEVLAGAAPGGVGREGGATFRLRPALPVQGSPNPTTEYWSSPLFSGAISKTMTPDDLPNGSIVECLQDTEVYRGQTLLEPVGGHLHY